MSRLRLAAISFLNPAPLLYHFEHEPHAEELARRYAVRYTQPSQCAADLIAGDADVGLIPIAALAPELAIVPGSTIASREKVRSIQLIVRSSGGLAGVRSVATDAASRSSLAYTQILFRSFLKTDPVFLEPVAADPVGMLRTADAALLIGDPALIALEQRQSIEAAVGPCSWFDVAQQWVLHTGLPWVAAVWAARPEALNAMTAGQLVHDLDASREAGLAHREELVREWTPRISLPPATIRHYLTHNIEYILAEDCVEAIRRFRSEASRIGVLPPLTRLRFL